MCITHRFLLASFLFLLALSGAVEVFAHSTQGDHYYRFTRSGFTGEGGTPTSACSTWCGTASPQNSPCSSNDEDDGTIFSCLFASGNPITNSTKSVEHCAPGEVYDDINKTCQPPCPPCHARNPQTQACEFSCEAGETCNANNQCEEPLTCEEDESLFCIGDQCSCTPKTTSPNECDDVAGYVIDAQGAEHQICNDDKNDCESTGGTYGIFNGDTRCLGEDFDDDLPTCDINSVVVADGGGGFVCSSTSDVDDPDNPDVPNEGETNDEKDTDGDGIPDKDDDDIDGDGTNNGTDGDIDGDGIDNADDPTPNGEDESSVKGGGSCRSRPVCNGDAVDCANLYQLWSLRCESQDTGKVTGGGDCENAPVCSGNVVLCSINTQVWQDRCTSFAEDQAALDAATEGLGPGQLFAEETDLTDTLSNIFTAGSSSGQCPADYNLDLMGTTIPFSYAAICSLALILYPLVLVLFSLSGLRIIWSAF